MLKEKKKWEGVQTSPPWLHFWWYIATVKIFQVVRKQKKIESHCNKAMKNILLVKKFVFYPLIYPRFSKGRREAMPIFQFG